MHNHNYIITQTHTHTRTPKLKQNQINKDNLKTKEILKLKFVASFKTIVANLKLYKKQK